jgi:hypothetical protein
MSKEELLNYRFQLSQVEDALTKDPLNEEYLKLKIDLCELVDLYTTLQEQEEEQQTEKVELKRKRPGFSIEEGAIVLGKFTDGNYYEALVVGTKNELYECVFTGSEQITLLDSESIREKKPGSTTKTILESAEVVIGSAHKENEKEKKKYVQKKKRTTAKRDVYDNQRQEQWQAFAKKNKKIKK